MKEQYECEECKKKTLLLDEAMSVLKRDQIAMKLAQEHIIALTKIIKERGDKV